MNSPVANIAIRTVSALLLPVGSGLVADAAQFLLPELENLLPAQVKKSLADFIDIKKNVLVNLLSNNYAEHSQLQQAQINHDLARAIVGFWEAQFNDLIGLKERDASAIQILESRNNRTAQSLKEEITLLDFWRDMFKKAQSLENSVMLEQIFSYLPQSPQNLTIIDAIQNENNAERLLWTRLQEVLFDWARKADSLDEIWTGQLSPHLSAEIKKAFFSGLKDKIGIIIKTEQSVREAFKYGATFHTIDLIKRIGEENKINFGEIKFELKKTQIDLRQVMDFLKIIEEKSLPPLQALQLFMTKLPDLHRLRATAEKSLKNTEKIKRGNRRIETGIRSFSRQQSEFRKEVLAEINHLKSLYAASQTNRSRNPPVSEVPGEAVGGKIPFEELVSVRTDNLAIDIIRAINSEAAIFYRNVVNGEKNTINYPEIWSQVWDKNDVKVQKHYIDTKNPKGESIKDKICSLLLETHGEKEIYGYRPETKIWLVGSAGVGKTSSLYRTFFGIITSPNPYPTPLLLQPRLFDEDSIKRLDAVEDDRRFLELLVIIWLENRNINIPAECVGEFLEGLKKGLRNGEIAILIDSYDELVRFKFQTKIFKNLLDRTQICVSASRPETYDNDDKNIVVAIDDAWNIETVKQFLEDRLENAAPFINHFIGYVSKNHSAEWLRNPRYLNLFVDTIYQRSQFNFASFAGVENLNEVLNGGEYLLLKVIHREAVKRLERSLPAGSPLKSDEGFYTETTKRLHEIAVTELKYGTLHLSEEEYRTDLYWQTVIKATDLIKNPFLDEESKNFEVKFLNYNFVDYFLTEQLAAQIYNATGQIKQIHQWSNTLINYLTRHFIELIHGGRMNARHLENEIKQKVRNFVATNHRTGNRCRTVKDFDSDCCYMAVNLIKLLFNLITLADEKFSAELSGEDFSDIYLDSIDFSNVPNLKFNECNFSGSILTNSILNKAKFYDCVFDDTNFRNSLAHSTEFWYCDFNFHQTAQEKEENSAVQGMVVQGLVLEQCNAVLDDFVKSGARLKESRYAGEFGKRFRKQMSDFLGVGIKRAEAIYVNKIEAALRAIEPREEIYLIDIMAGDMSQRFQKEILRKFNGSFKINLFAIDKDATTINQDVTFFEANNININIWEKEISGRLELKMQLKDRFGVDAVDLIFGKKTIHELSAINQRELFAECSECLSENGRLVLYTDSPPSISDEGFNKLTALVEQLRKKPNIYHLKRIFIEELSFNGGVDDEALFINLWIALKDYANDNSNELQNRYFSSLNQILNWATAAGLKNENVAREDCHLMPKMFNENAFSKISAFLNESTEGVSSKDKEWIEETLFGDDKYQLLRDFTEKHLWDKQTKDWTRLGTEVKASWEEIKFGKIHDKLQKFSFSNEADNKDIRFVLPVHILSSVKQC